MTRMAMLVGACDPQCPWCARDWWRWLAGREAQMSRPRRGETVPFSAAALSSVRAAVSGFEILVGDTWLDVSEGEWSRYLGHRRLDWGSVGWVEYHGPAWAADGRPSRETRACRCDTCTLFEDGRDLPTALAAVVAEMLTRTFEGTAP